MKKICIIGAGPAGCFIAYLLAKRRYDFEIFEKKKKIGKIQCGGALTSTINKIDAIFKTKEFNKTIINRVTENILHSPNNNLVIKFKNPEYVVDRIKFDNFIADKAKKAGVKMHLNAEFIKILERGNKIGFMIKKENKSLVLETDILIGADGALSNVCKSIGTKRNLELAIEARCSGKFKKNSYEIFLGKEYGNFYAWIIPESSKIARIGLFNDFTKFDELIKRLNVKILEMRSGYIPIDKPIKCHYGNVYLLGDAGCHVKASTGGGIVPSLNAAKILADAISAEKNFEKCGKNCKRDLYKHYLIRKMLNKFSDKDYNELFDFIAKNKRIKKFLEEGSRDEISPHKFPISLKMLKFGKKIF